MSFNEQKKQILTWCVPEAEFNSLIFKLQAGCVVLKHSRDISLQMNKDLKGALDVKINLK